MTRPDTIAAYNAFAREYAEGTASLPREIRAEVERFATALGGSGDVLEIGSGGGRDALALEGAGLRVRRSDVAPAFVELLREQGHEADVLDPLTDELGGPYDGVWAQACLLHVARADLPVVMTRLAEAVRAGGRLMASFKEGDGDGWSTHGSLKQPRHFTYWREEPLTSVLQTAGWRVEGVGRTTGRLGDQWLDVRAQRLG